MQLQGKTALVTGASRGIGRAIAAKLAAEGADVMLVARTAVDVEAAVGELREAGYHAIDFTADVTDRDQVKNLRKYALEAFGKVDILVNNAGTSYIANLMLADDAKWWGVVETNLRSCYLCTKAFLPGMTRAGFGRVVNISSISGQLGASFNSCYAASKAAVDGLTRSVALEVAARGVTVNAVCPGFVRTDLAKYTMAARGKMFGLDANQYLDKLEKEIPRKSLVTVEEVADTVTYLAGPAASAITGQTINVCGGLSLG